jgi:hypothetical protein
MGQDGQGLALPVFMLEAGQIFLAPRIVAEQQHCRFGKSPREISVPELRAGRAIPLPGGCLGALDQAARGHEILAPEKAGDVVDLVQQHKTQALPKPRDGLEQVQGVGVMLLRRLHNGQRQVLQQRVVIVAQGEVHLDAFLNGGIGKSFRDPRPVGLGGAVLTDRGQVVLAVGLLDMRQQLSAFPYERYPASE